jgi:hypothetical protein
VAAGAGINLREETRISVIPDSVARFIGHLVRGPSSQRIKKASETSPRPKYAATGH